MRAPSRRPAPLTQQQLRMLRWLAREDMQQYGECFGPTLNALQQAGFVRTTTDQFNPDLPDDQPEAAWPPPSKFCAVNLTEAARDYIRDNNIDIWVE